MQILLRSQFLLIFLGLTLICSGQLEEGGNDSGVINGVAVPAGFPELEIIVNENPAPGKIFMANNEGPPYLLMFENDGTPAYYERLEYSARDFKLQTNGNVSYGLKDDGVFTRGFVIRDSNFEPLDTVSAAKGFKTDVHDLTIAPNGHYLLIGVSYLSVDMSQVVEEGRTDAELKGCHIHELNSDHELVFEWECWDHFKATDAIGVDLTQKALDYVHMNSVAVDYDGHLLISSRNLSECTKINRQTGEVIWRLGGKNNQFNWINDSEGISCQHDIRPVEGKPGQYTIFDNGNYHETPYTRAIEVLVDTSNMTVEIVWEYRHSPDIYDSSMGNAQRLENGNTLINYSNVSLPKVCEVSPDGEIVYKADLNLSTHVYRTFRFNWTGSVPIPSLIAEQYSSYTRLVFNKFGDETVDYYRIYSGDTPDSLVLTDSTAYTWRKYSDLPDSSLIYFGVSAIHMDGSESPMSDIASIFNINRIRGENLINNGDFSTLSTHWQLEVKGGGQASGEVEDEIFDLEVTEKGSAYSSIVLSQKGIPLEKGEKYRLEFDIRANQTAIIGLDIYNPEIVPRIDHSRIGVISVSETVEHYSFEFDMTESTDLNTRLDFQLGKTFGHVFIDNVCLRVVPEPIIAALSEHSDISCFNSGDGLISVSAIGGEGKLQYRLIPGAEENSTGVFIIEQGGVYTVEVRDETAQDPAKISDIRIDEPAQLLLGDLEITGVRQDDKQSGSLMVSAFGGNGEYIFTLFPDSISNNTGYFPGLDTGLYYVKFWDSAGCDTILSGDVFIDFFNSTMGNLVDSWCRIYPNPARDYVYIKEAGEMKDPLSMELYDSMGRLLLQREFRVELKLDLEGFSEGIYFVRIEDKVRKRSLLRKLLIH